jgi:hypothetical protein
LLNASPAGEDRTKGFRLFREGNAAEQRIKVNVGTGTGEVWNDGQIITAPGDWVHIGLTISGTQAIIYVNGAVAMASAMPAGINWTGCNVFGIGSGAPNFTYWGHAEDLSSYDELRMFNKALTQAEIQTIIDNDFSYVPKYGEIFYMPFEGTYKDIISKTTATAVGTPSFATGKKGQAYKGATNSYLTYPTTEFAKSTSFSAVFWMKVNAVPDRAGILTAGPEDTANPGYPAVQNKRTNGFRFFREGSATAQVIKSNVGIGTGDVWNDGGTTDPSGGQWIHVAFTVSNTQSSVYINGVLTRAASALTTPMNWTGCNILTIMSGYPRFTEWGHLSDLSLMDELRIFNKGLSAAEVLTIYNDEK